MASKQSQELKRERSIEYYYKNREKMLAYQNNYRKQMIEEARNRKTYDSMEELFEDWNAEIIKKLENEDLDEVIRTILLDQIVTNTEIMSRKPKKINVLKDGKLVETVDGIVATATKYGMYNSALFQCILNDSPNKDGFKFCYADEADKKKEKVEIDERTNGFHIPRNKNEKKQMLLQFINKHMAQRWRNVSYDVEAMERKFVRELIEEL